MSVERREQVTHVRVESTGNRRNFLSWRKPVGFLGVALESGPWRAAVSVTAIRKGRAGSEVQDFSQIEILTAAELAARLKVRESWIVEQTKPSRASDPIPKIRFGKHNRYAWGSKAFMAWLARRFAS
jgi:hypothetical protein